MGGWSPCITENHKRVVCPEIDVIHHDTLEFSYQNSNSTFVGGFNWDLLFTWISLPEVERKRRNNSAEPMKSPTMAGGLFSIDKAFFNKLGQYDDGFDISGGEHLELSFKTWMCGGTLEIIPCSHVGHIFRPSPPYKGIPGVNHQRKNAVRLAEVWMDDYKDIYYQRIGHDLGEYGDISGRQKLRRDLNCKSFQWFLETVYPYLIIPEEAASHGEIRNLGLGGETCLDSPTFQDHLYKAVGLYPCHGQGGNQFWTYSKTGEIRRDDVCLDYNTGNEILLNSCHGQSGNQLWTFEERTNQLVHFSQKCLSILTKENLSVEACNDVEDRQKWKLENFDKFKLNIKK